MNLHDESFGIAASSLSRRYQVNSTAATWSISADGPGGRRAVRRQTTSDGNAAAVLRYSPQRRQGGIWTPQTGIVVSMLVKVTDLAKLASSNSGAGGFIEVFGSANVGLFQMFRFDILADGSMVAQNRLFNYNTLFTTASILEDDQWSFIECELEIGATGMAAISHNGVEVGAVSGVDTRPSSLGFTWTNTWSSVDLLGLPGTGGSPFLDIRMLDLYIFDRSGSRNNTRIGIHEVHRLLVNGAGGFAGWTPNIGTNHSAVEDMPEDDATTIVAASAADTRDEWQFESVPPGVDPPAAMLTLVAQKVGPNAAAVTPRFLGTEEPVGMGAPPDEFRHLMAPYDTNPTTTDPITSADMQNPLAGVLKSL